ncbi:phosphoribosyl-AMP cyclohydrolase [Candidatus Woesearchaeota archaeon]|nr:phosphoribosyl-AMP cyclohydrolase [Candidatus Woesearchaeota archaeon]
MDRNYVRVNAGNLVAVTRFRTAEYLRKDECIEQLVPVVTVEYDTGNLLMVAFSNREALRKTAKSGMATYWSRSREEIWEKGKESGNSQVLMDMSMKRDNTGLLYRVVQLGKDGACHLPDRYSCFDNGRVL